MASKKSDNSVFEKPSEKKEKGSGSRPAVIRFLIILIILAGLGSGIYYYAKYQNAQKLLGNSKDSSIETKELVDKVGKFVALPVNETPTIATVSDVTKLKGQAFFAHAQNGDKVLIYQKAKKAILYRPTENKIIEFSSVNIDAEKSPPPASSASISPKQLRVVLYNGTRIAGFAGKVEKELKEKDPSLAVVAKSNATKTDYEKTLVIDLSGSQKDQASALADLLNGEVGSLPSGEVKPNNADILVILGGK